MQNKKNIVLIGMMGAGKSTVAEFLNKKLLDFLCIDIDTEIENYANKSVKDIFTQHGEAYFRNLEHEIVTKFSDKNNQIISTGGGVVEILDNMDLLKINGVVFYLKASAEELFKRINQPNQPNRPMLNHPNPKQRLQELIQKREPAYKTADFEINTENKTLEQITDEIIEKYETIN